MGKIKIPRMNRAQIAGRITKDPEPKRTPAGAAVTRFTVAVDRSYKGKDDKWQTETVFLSVQAWAALAERTCNDAKKGSPVIVEGRIAVTKWDDAQGNHKELTEIVADRIDVLEWADDNASTSESFTSNSNGNVPF
jgi:single-strand DNA-binding protein